MYRNISVLNDFEDEIACFANVPEAAFEKDVGSVSPTGVLSGCVGIPIADVWGVAGSWL